MRDFSASTAADSVSSTARPSFFKVASLMKLPIS